MANKVRLINANALKDRIRQEPTDGMYTAEILEAIDEVPTVDAAPVVHGRWEPCYETFDEDPSLGIPGGDVQTGWECSICGRYETDKEPYCHCGAKMDGA